MKLLYIVLFSSFIANASNVFPIKKMICSGYVVNAPDELHEGYYYIGAVLVESNESVEVYNCLGGSIDFVRDRIKSGKCGYSGVDNIAQLKFKKFNNKTIVYNDKKTLSLVLGYKTPKNLYELDGKYHFWGDVVPKMYYQLECRAALK